MHARSSIYVIKQERTRNMIQHAYIHAVPDFVACENMPNIINSSPTIQTRQGLPVIYEARGSSRLTADNALATDESSSRSIYIPRTYIYGAQRHPYICNCMSAMRVHIYMGAPARCIARA